MSDYHSPVMAEECVAQLRTLKTPLQTFMDGTLGRGGHLKRVLTEFPQVQAVAFDRDKAAIDFSKNELANFLEEGRLELIHGNFDTVDEKVKDKKFDAILIDLGVSSPQLDTPQRGFSFYQAGPLDMRMNQDDELTAEEIINEWTREELIEVFQKYGEVKRPHKVVDKICEKRQDSPFQTTTELADFIAKILGWRKKGRHPATQFFLALRIVVNNEIRFLEPALIKLISHLEPSGRLLVLTFHSTEDRIVKWTFKEAKSLGAPLFKKVIKPTREEELKNPRSRSAKLRVFEKHENREA